MDVLTWFARKSAARFMPGTADQRRVLMHMIMGKMTLSDLVAGLLLCAEEYGVTIDGQLTGAEQFRIMLDEGMQGSLTR